jgi:hypothetical protein
MFKCKCSRQQEPRVSVREVTNQKISVLVPQFVAPLVSSRAYISSIARDLETSGNFINISL